MLRFEYPSKQLILRSPNSKEYPEILKLYFEYFLKDEPGSKSRGGYPRGIPLKVKDDIIKYLNEDLSLVAVDSTNDQICGFAINYCIPRYFKEGFKILFWIFAPFFKDINYISSRNSYKKIGIQDMLCKGYPKTYAMLMQVCQDSCPLDEFFQQFHGRLPKNFKKSI